jgi:cation transport ATPase
VIEPQGHSISGLRAESSPAARVVFALALLALTWLAWLQPYYDWDMVAYVGAAIATHEHDAKAIHDQAFASLRKEIPKDAYDEISADTGFRRDIAKNPQHFYQQLRFYTIRPLWIYSIVALHALGIGYVLATRVLSLAAFVATGILLFAWARRYCGDVRACISILLLLIAPVVFTSARTGYPDMTSGFLLLLVTYLLVERAQLAVAAIILIASLFIRTDNVLYTLLLLAWYLWQRRDRRTLLACAAVATVAMAIVPTLNRFGHAYSWKVLMVNTADPVVNPAEISPSFTVKDYFWSWNDLVDEARGNSFLAFPLLAAIVLLSRAASARMKTLVAIVLLSWIARLVLFPHLEDRYFLAGSCVIALAAIVTFLDNRASAPVSA